MDVSGGFLANLDAVYPCRHDGYLHFHALWALDHESLRGDENNVIVLDSPHGSLKSDVCEAKTNLTAPVRFVIRTIDETSSLKGGDYGKVSCYRC